MQLKQAHTCTSIILQGEIAVGQNNKGSVVVNGVSVQLQKLSLRTECSEFKTSDSRQTLGRC